MTGLGEPDSDDEFQNSIADITEMHDPGLSYQCHISDILMYLRQTNQAIFEMALKMSSSMKRTTTIKRQDYITKPGQCLKTQKLDTFMRIGHNLERTKVIT